MSPPTIQLVDAGPNKREKIERTEAIIMVVVEIYGNSGQLLLVFLNHHITSPPAKAHPVQFCGRWRQHHQRR
jgi:hypothetical protein